MGYTMLATSTTGGTTMTTAIESLMSVATTVLTIVTSNPELAVFFFASLIFTAIAVVKKLK